MVKTMKIVICSECGKTLNPAKELIELICIPSEWYMQKDLLDKWTIYQCVDCGIVFRTSRKKERFYNQLKEMPEQIWAFIKSQIYEPVEES